VSYIQFIAPEGLWAAVSSLQIPWFFSEKKQKII
jgi:hypothetical protein